MAPWLPPASGFGSLDAWAWVNSGPEERLMAALSRDAPRRRVLEHTKRRSRLTEASTSRHPSPGIRPTAKIRLVLNLGRVADRGNLTTACHAMQRVIFYSA